MRKFFRRIAVSSFIITLSMLALSAIADETSMPMSFERIKALAGDWQGTMISPETGKEELVKVHYEVTSGGKAVMERIFVGTPMEMVSVYYPKGNSVGMTHFCMLGTQPTFSQTKADDKSVTLESKAIDTVQSPNEPQMSGISMTFEGKDTLVQDWSCTKDGKLEHTTVKLTRIQ